MISITEITFLIILSFYFFSNIFKLLSALTSRYMIGLCLIAFSLYNSKLLFLILENEEVGNRRLAIVLYMEEIHIKYAFVFKCIN